MWRIRNLLREWKTNIVCLQETKLQLVSRAVVYSLSPYQHVDQRYLSLRGASRGNLLMWDRRALEKVEECVGGGGHFLLLALSEMLMTILSGLLRVFMALMLIMTEEFYIG